MNITTTPTSNNIQEFDLSWLKSANGVKFSLIKRNEAGGIFRPQFVLSNGRQLTIEYDGGEEAAETVLIPKDDSSPPRERIPKEKIFSVNSKRKGILFVVKKKSDEKSFEILSPQRDVVLMKFLIPSMRSSNVSIVSSSLGTQPGTNIGYRANLSNRRKITIKRPDGQEIGNITGLGTDIETKGANIVKYKCNLTFLSSIKDPESGLCNEEKFIMTAFFISLGVNFESEIKNTTFLCTCCMSIWLSVNLVVYTLLVYANVFGTITIALVYYYVLYALVMLAVAYGFYWFIS